MWSNDIKCKCMFMFPLHNLARKDLTFLPMLAMIIMQSYWWPLHCSTDDLIFFLTSTPGRHHLDRWHKSHDFLTSWQRNAYSKNSPSGHGPNRKSGTPNCLWTHRQVTHRGWEKMDAILQATFPKSFSYYKIVKNWCTLHCNVFPWVQLTISQHWFR